MVPEPKQIRKWTEWTKWTFRHASIHCVHFSPLCLLRPLTAPDLQPRARYPQIKQQYGNVGGRQSDRAGGDGQVELRNV